MIYEVSWCFATEDSKLLSRRRQTSCTGDEGGLHSPMVGNSHVIKSSPSTYRLVRNLQDERLSCRPSPDEFREQKTRTVSTVSGKLATASCGRCPDSPHHGSWCPYAIICLRARNSPLLKPSHREDHNVRRWYTSCKYPVVHSVPPNA